MRKRLIIAFILFPTLLLSCTIALVSGELTEDGRPLLWKNRDVSNPYQGVEYFATSPYSFLALVSPGDELRAWAGINEIGFGIVNSNSYNLGAPDPANYTDGFIMYEALRTCSTVEEFEELLRDYPPNAGYNFAVMDGYGGLAVLEACPEGFIRVSPPIARPFIIRANFSFAGTPCPRRGIHRYQRARYIIENLLTRGPIDYTLLIDSVASDLTSPDIDPYPLPFDSESDEFPPGVFPADESINRITTRAGVFIRGVRTDEDKSGGLMIFIPGEPVLGVPYPVWVKAGSVPSALRDSGGSLACLKALAVKRIVEHFTDQPTWFDSYVYMTLKGKLDPIKSFAFTEIRRMEPLDGVSMGLCQEALANEILRQYNFMTHLFVQEPEKTVARELVCYPNPFNTELEIELPLEFTSAFDILIVNTVGKIVWEKKGLSGRKVTWKGENCRGEALPSGLYKVIVVNKGAYSWKKSVILLR